MAWTLIKIACAGFVVYALAIWVAVAVEAWRYRKASGR